MTIKNRAASVFRTIDCPDSFVEVWINRLKTHQLQDYPHEEFVWYSCVLAIKAMSEGNYGVGAIIVKGNEIIAEGYNQLLKPYLRTDQHAEMNALTEFEDKYRFLSDRREYTLITSLECCPMCTTRLINSGIRKVYFAASDPECGMVQLLDNMPPFWKRMMNKRTPKQQFLKADCSLELTKIAEGIFLETEQTLSTQVADF